MLMNEIPVKQDDGYTTILYPHYTEAAPKGTVLIAHGMSEHHSRYLEFTAFLNHCGYDVFLYDHRGHGTDKKLEELGIFAEKDGDIKVTQDLITYDMSIACIERCIEECVKKITAFREGRKLGDAREFYVPARIMPKGREAFGKR